MTRNPLDDAQYTNNDAQIDELKDALEDALLYLQEAVRGNLNAATVEAFLARFPSSPRRE